MSESPNLVPRQVPSVRSGYAGLSLQQFLLVALLLVSLPGVIISGGFAYRNVQHATDEFIHSQAIQISESVQRDLAAFFDEPVQVVSLNVAQFRAGLLDAQHRDKFVAALAIQARQYPKVTMVGIGLADGEYYAVNQPQLGDEKGLLADRSLIANKREIHVCRINESNYDCPALNIEGGLYDARSRPWFKRAVQTGHLTWNPLYLYPESSVPMYGPMGISVSAPIVDAAGGLIGVAAASVSLAHLGNVLQAHSSIHGGLYFIAETGGDLLAQSSSNSIFESQNRPLKRKNIFNNDNPLIHGAAQLIKASGQVSGNGDITIGREHQHIQWHSHQLGNGPTLLIGVILPRAQFDMSSRNMLRNIVVLTLALILFGVLVATVATRWMSRPMGVLSDFSKRIAAGDFHVIPAARGRIREVATLTTSMETMAHALQHTTENLEHIVQQRTAQLEIVNQRLNEEMAQANAARQQADVATRAKSRFLASASHDLRQPAMAQGLFLDILSRTSLDADQRKLLDNLRTANTALSQMLDTLLDYSRIEAGVIHPVPQDFRLQLLLNKIEREFGAQADVRNLIFRSRETDRVVHTDPALLELILRNLVSNAIRYTEQGGVLVACRHRGAQVWLEVWDTGIGIAPEHQQEIFDEFMQLGNPERDRNKGLGLGLSIANGLAQSLGHRLSLVSRPGRGSVFRLTLPSGTGVPPEIASAPERAVLLQGRRMLVIDDDEAVRTSLQHLLADWGCPCDAVDTIAAALASARQHPPAIVISDYRLRGKETGVDAIAALRAEVGNDLPALLITGDIALKYEHQSSAGLLPVLRKPVTLEELHSALSALLAPAQAAVPSEASSS